MQPKLGLEEEKIQGGWTPKCFICQAYGHSKKDCTVDKDSLWCEHCKTRRHNTSKWCPKYKKKNNPKENPKDKKDTKDPKLKPRKKGQARTVKETGKNDEEPEDEDDEDDDTADLLLYGCRLKWWPVGDETDEDLDTSSEPEVFYLDSENESEDSSGNESGYFTPPLTPAAAPAEELLGEDFMTEDEDEPIKSDDNIHPPLLSDSEHSDSEENVDSEDDDIDTPIRCYLNNELKSSVARGCEDQIPPGARVWTDETPQDDSRVEYQEVTAELLLNLLEMNVEENTSTETVTASESPPAADSNTAPEDEPVISTAEETPSGLTPVEKEADFDLEEDQTLLDCVKLDLEVEDIINRVGTLTPIFVTTSMWS